MTVFHRGRAALLIVAIVGCDGGAAQASGDLRQRRTAAERPAGAESGKVLECLISARGIGPVRLGATIEDARRAFPSAKFDRTSDGDGAALVEVIFSADTSITVWAGEDDPDEPIDWSKTIKAIETFSPACHTVDGIHPGMLVVDVEKVFGSVKQFVKSEIESREYVSFARQPASLTLRIDDSSDFPQHSRESRGFSSNAKILSIIVSPARTP